MVTGSINVSKGMFVSVYSSLKISLDEMGGLEGVMPSSPLKAIACHNAYTKCRW